MATTMTYNLLRGIGRTVQILGLVILSACFSGHSLASIRSGLVKGDDLILTQSSDETIFYSFTVNTSEIDQKLNVDQVEIDTGDIGYQALKEIVADQTVYLGNGETFDLGGLSKTFKNSGQDLQFNIKFSKAKIKKWLAGKKEKKLLFYPVLHASNDKGSSSTKYPVGFEVTIKVKGEHAHISGLDDIELPRGDFMEFCVSSTTEKVRLDFRSTNSKNSFQLQADDQSNSDTIGYEVTLEGKQNRRTRTITLKNPQSHGGHKWDAHKASFSDLDCNGIDNMKLRIDMNQDDAKRARPGTYKDTITIEVAAA